MNRPVNFELAKLLKEKGFEQETPGYEDHKYSFYAINDFDNDWRDSFSKRREGELLEGYYLAPLTEKRENVVIIAPTITEVVMWLYEKHGIWINPIPRLSSWIFTIQEVRTGSNESLIDIDFYESNTYLNFKGVPTIMNSPTEAYEAAIEYTLKNLI